MSSRAGDQPRQDQRGGSVIANVFDVLRCFTTDEPEQGVTEIARRVGLHKSSVSRILATLEGEDIVQRDPVSRRYRLGIGLIGIAAPLLASLDVRRVALEELVRLRDATGETAALTVWDGREAVTVEQVASLRNVKHTSPLGARYQTAVSASVQVFCAQEDFDRVEVMLASGLLERHGPLTADAYRLRLQGVRERGVAINDGETLPDETGVAAPVFDHRGLCVAAVLLAAPRFRAGGERLDELAREVRETALSVSRRMGAQSSAPAAEHGGS